MKVEALAKKQRRDKEKRKSHHSLNMRSMFISRINYTPKKRENLVLIKRFHLIGQKKLGNNFLLACTFKINGDLNICNPGEGASIISSGNLEHTVKLPLEA